jgi:cellulose synthase/poly-beta-1,6-N-acetylglucosamine synthase-like glycosyltransferase
MIWPAILLLSIQIMLLLVFFVFSVFNYLYGFASLYQPRIRRTQPSGRKVAVVIVAFNEKYVLEDTIRACDQLTYQNKVTVVADDSSDPVVIDRLREMAKKRGCHQVLDHKFYQVIPQTTGQSQSQPIEIWESSHFILFHRPSNVGFKGGSLHQVHRYLESRGIELMYLLDADWHPQSDALERTLEVLEVEPQIAFVQTKRISSQKGMNLFQKYVALVEEGCYYVDFEGRQVLGHPTLFSGCCTLFRLQAISDVGGFTPGHLTEDLDLTNRFWLSGWKGVYLGNVFNYGEVPFTYDHYRRQQERWSAGTARSLRDYFWKLLRSPRLNWLEKLSAIRQNMYFSTTVLTGFAILLGMITIGWLAFGWNSYEVEFYLYILEPVKIPLVLLVYFCILSNFVEPIIMIVAKKRTYRDLLHLPMMVWYAWSVLLTYILGNIKGFFRIDFGWFRTPKFFRHQVGPLSGSPPLIRFLNLCVCTTILGFYFSEGWVFGWFDTFGLLLIPAFLISSFK